MPWRDWIRTIEVEPSIYGADFANLGDQLEALLRSECRVFHFDTGDGHFVEPITMGPIVLESIAPLVHQHGGAIDVHLMAEDPAGRCAAIAAAALSIAELVGSASSGIPTVVVDRRLSSFWFGWSIRPIDWKMPALV